MFCSLSNNVILVENKQKLILTINCTYLKGYFNKKCLV